MILHSLMRIKKEHGKTDAGKTLKHVATIIKAGTREVEKKGWVVLKLLGMGAPGLYLNDKSVNPVTVPNIPGLALIKPAEVLEDMLGNEWKVYINNDGIVQAIASAHAFVQSSNYKKKWSGIVEGTGSRIIFFGPGTGFGAGKIVVRPDRQVTPMSGSSAFFDLHIRDGKTAEELLGGFGIGNIAQAIERENIKRGRVNLLKFTKGYREFENNHSEILEEQLSAISSKIVSNAYFSGESEAKAIAKEIFIQAGRDLARLMIQLYKGKGKKITIKWNRDDWQSVKGTSIFLAAGLLIKPAGKELILPSAREVLSKAGYSEKIYIVEIDQLPAMRNIHGKIGIVGASLIVPGEEILSKKCEHFLIAGRNNVNRFIYQLTKKAIIEYERPVILAIDGYSGIDWKKSITQLKKSFQEGGVSLKLIDFSRCYKSHLEMEKLLSLYKGNDETFGRIFGGKLENLLVEGRINGLKELFENYLKKKSRLPKALICFGPGSACRQLRGLYDIIFYRDITREEITRRNAKGLVAPLGIRGGDKSVKGQPAYLAGRRFYYLDFPVLDKHKKNLNKEIHFYIDDNLAGKPKLIDKQILDEMISNLAQEPIQLKAFHDEGVWGGQWLKKNRNLPAEMVNCAWGYELMAYQMSVKIPVGSAYLEIPFANLLDAESENIMGRRVNKIFKGIWPIRVNYDDCWEGGDMAIQIHPDSSYIKNNFNEFLHQDESYYIMASAPGSYVYLGLKEGLDLNEFSKAVRKAEKEGIPFDHRKYVNVFPAKEGDLFLIPAGTLHASGKGCVVLELSSTTDRYTFHLYDYLRPDLNGKLREIHSAHAFNMANKYPHRTTLWVKKEIIQKPRIIRKGRNWAEYLLGKFKDMVFEVHRFEFKTTIEDDTKEVPHVLSMVKGERVLIQSRVFRERQFVLNFSETVIVPACFGKYVIINQGNAPCHVLKTIVNNFLLQDR